MTTLAVIGLGLIGASSCAAIKMRMPGWTIHGFSRTETTRQRALARGLVDQCFESVELTVFGADLILIAVPMGQFSSVFNAVWLAREEYSVVTDVGSTKGAVVDDLIAVTKAIPSWFVPGHPIAGSEQSGVNAANPDLFVDHQVILTPLAETATSALELVTEFWEKQGASVSIMNVARHDEVLALTSHLPHILAFSLVHALPGRAKRDDWAGQASKLKNN